jgi:IS1 family transposase
MLPNSSIAVFQAGGKAVMRVLERERKVMIVNGLCNGMSLRGCSRTFGAHRTAIQRLLVRVGENCERVMEEYMIGVECKYLEIDELWTFCGKKERRLRGDEVYDPDLGDQYVFFALDSETKLVPAYAVGKRNVRTATDFLVRLHSSLNGGRPQISSDAWSTYPDLIDGVFGVEVDYAAISKQYEGVYIGPGRYAPPRVSGVSKSIWMGNPDMDKISTSHIERSNLTIRTMQRRFTRLALGFSRKMQNLRAAVALHFAYYNFVWQPRTLRGLTPALAAGVSDRLWSVEDLLEA